MPAASSAAAVRVSGAVAAAEGPGCGKDCGEGGDADGAAEVGRGLEHPGGDASVGRGRAAEGVLGEGDEGRGQGEADEQERRQHVLGIGGLVWSHGQGQHGDQAEQQTGGPGPDRPQASTRAGDDQSPGEQAW